MFITIDEIKYDKKSGNNAGPKVIIVKNTIDSQEIRKFRPFLIDEKPEFKRAGISDVIMVSFKNDPKYILVSSTQDEFRRQLNGEAR